MVKQYYWRKSYDIIEENGVSKYNIYIYNIFMLININNVFLISFNLLSLLQMLNLNK